MYTVSTINANTPPHLNIYTCGYESVHVAAIYDRSIYRAIEHRYDVVSDSY